jgi:hypothetical protein
MKTLLLPYVQISALYQVTPREGRPFFDTQDIAGRATKGSHTPNLWTSINGVEDPIVQRIDKNGDVQTSPGNFVDILRFIESSSTQSERQTLIDMAEKKWPCDKTAGFYCQLQQHRR